MGSTLRAELIFYFVVPLKVGRVIQNGREGVVAQWGKVWWLNGGKVWWLNGSTSDCSPAVPGSNPVPPQPIADCQSSGGLPPGMALG